ncbi:MULTISPECIES: sulfotransferase family 2 domain-containing protein [Vibrio]|uniref:sulfotransferase family 2 domain-containing protein n=1 Tax=Vibrio TaxID=662 RepID=UPI0002376723|nr:MULTISPECIES: sulfotransferase family 2 domain-containing protein [Vibrio]MDK9775112.1 sulfotransferase family 2 domain-containing protein [Vibrio sp. D401a]MDK9807778.1 sulfotransferase family protein [Vibrio sp. D406a]
MYNVLYCKSHGLVYISNPKVACSSIKNSLLCGFDGDVHLEARKRLSLPNNKDIPIFILTRNPYSRALSVYKDRIENKHDVVVRDGFCKKYGLETKDDISFYQFLSALNNDKDKSIMDMHYRPQVLNLYTDDVEPCFIGRIERMKEVEIFLSRYNVNLVNKIPHARNASNTYIDEISQDEAKLIESIYSQDFDLLGYDRNIKNINPPECIYQEQVVRGEYLKLVSSKYTRLYWELRFFFVRCKSLIKKIQLYLIK